MPTPQAFPKPAGYDNSILADLLLGILAELRELNGKQPLSFKFRKLIGRLYWRVGGAT